jgi:membrane protein implicated in regulation of membrane protease activity
VKIKINLFVVFLVLLALKLTETVTWSWWVITAPLWVPLAISGVLFVLFILFAGYVVSTASKRTQPRGW